MAIPKSLPAAFFIAVLVTLAGLPCANAQLIVLNPGFESVDTNFPGSASNWYGYTTGTGSSAAVTQWATAVYAGTNGFLLEPHTQGTNDIGQAHLGSDHWTITAGSTNDFSFMLKLIGATASGVWGNYNLSFFDNSHGYISSTATVGFGYDWGNWTNVVSLGIVAPSNASYVGADFYAFAQDASTAGQAQYSIDNVSLVPEPGTTALLGLGMACIGLVLRRRHRLG